MRPWGGWVPCSGGHTVVQTSAEPRLVVPFRRKVRKTAGTHRTRHKELWARAARNTGLERPQGRLREPGRTGAGQAARASKEILQPERPRPCGKSEKPLCSGHRPRLPGTCGPRTPGATAHSGAAHWVSLRRRRRRRVTLSEAAAAPSCGLLLSRGLLGLFIE